jgi:hypothetical protein
VEDLYQSLVSLARTNRDEHNEALARVGILYRTNTLVTFANSTAENTLLSATIPGKTLSTDRTIRITIIGDIKNNSGGNVTYIFRGKYGATTFFNTGAQTITYSSANRRCHWLFRTTITNLGATNAQLCFTEFNHCPSATDGVAGEMVANIPQFQASHESVAEDSTVDKTLALTVQMGTANANTDNRLVAAFVELIP